VSRERTVKEVFEKLLKYGLSDDDAGGVIEVLLKEGFIDETRYAKAFSHDKFGFNKWGRVKIRYELQRKGLSSPDIEAGLSVIREKDYRETAMQLLRRKASSLTEKSPYKLRSKLITHMIGKGYEPVFVMDLYDDMKNHQE